MSFTLAPSFAPPVPEIGMTLGCVGREEENTQTCNTTLPIDQSAYSLLKSLQLPPKLLNKCLILLGTLTRTHLRRKKKYYFCNMHSLTLARLVGDRFYRDVVKKLVENGVIEIATRANGKETYCPRTKDFKGYSKSYRVRPRYLANLVQTKVKLTARAPAAPDLTIQPALPRVTLSTEGVAAYERIYAQAPSAWRKECLTESVSGVLQKRWWVSRDDKTGRIFTNVSNMTKLLRPYLQIDSQPTVEIDVRNSQPYFATVLYPAPSAERARYVELVTSGGFYKAINAMLAAPIADPDKLKTKIFQGIFFGRLENRGAMWDAFAKVFPDLADEIVKKKTEDGYESFAVKLQELEARAIIAGVLAECHVVGIPVVSVHDSVICRVEDRERVDEMVRRHCLRVVGEMPALRVKVAA